MNALSRILSPAAALACLLALGAGWGRAATGGEASGEAKRVWHDDLEKALAIATSEYRPVLVVFSSPGCAWCAKLKSETLASPELAALLNEVVLAEINVLENFAAPERLGVRATPTTMVLSSDGTVIAGAAGFLKVADVTAMLQQALGDRAKTLAQGPGAGWVERLQEGKLSNKEWERLLAVLGDAPNREELIHAMLALEPLPRAAWVRALESPRLSVRHGALDVLEQAAGETFGYNPWHDGDDPARQADALARWQAWAQEEGTAGLASGEALGEDDMRRLLADLVSEDRNRLTRARRELARASREQVPQLDAFLLSNPGLVPGARDRVREARYVMLMPADGPVPRVRLANGLVFGNLDVRLRSLQQLEALGPDAIPILRDYLASPEPIVREVAVDALLQAGGGRVVPLIAQHLAQERDENVTFAVIRRLGGIPSKRGLALLQSYLKSDNEDLVVAALAGIGRLEAGQAAEAVSACLADPRWRVRVAALEAIAALDNKESAGAVAPLLADPDAFVQISAIKTLAKLEAKGVNSQLAALFYKDDKLKAPVVDALASLNASMPAGFAKALAATDPETIMAVLQTLGDHSKADLSLARTFATDKNADVRLTALRLLAARGMKDGRNRAVVTQALQTGDETTRQTIVEELKLDREAIYGRDQARNAQTAAQRKGLFARMMESLQGATSRAKPATNGAVTADAVMAAFAEAMPTAGKDTSTAALVNEVRKAAAAGPERQRAAAALWLAVLGDPSYLSVVGEQMAGKSSTQRVRVVDALEEVRGPEARGILAALLRDEDASVRAEAAEALCNFEGDPEAVDILFGELTRPNGRLKAPEVYQYRLGNVLNSMGPSKRRLEAWLRRILAEPADADQTVLALTLFPTVYISENKDAAVLEPYLSDDNPWVRRAAWYALGVADPEAFTQRLGQVLHDPHPAVRATVARAYSSERYNNDWTVHFGEAATKREVTVGSRYREGTPKLKPAARDALLVLVNDSDPGVRREAYFDLFAAGEGIDVSAFDALLAQTSDQRNIAYRVSNILRDRYESLGPEYAPLARHLEKSYLGDSDKLKIRRHFNVDDAFTAEVEEDLLVAAAPSPSQPSHFDPPIAENAPMQADAVHLVFFSSAGCSDCERVEGMLDELGRAFPGLEVSRQDIRQVSAMKYNEVLCERFDVPFALRSVSPAVFAAGGYLIKNDIDMQRLGELVHRSLGQPMEGWQQADNRELDTAAEAISQRFKTFGFGVVIGAGFLDGLNPCAFATIIFFLSYLQLSRRPRQQIAQVGLAFIVAVFLTYFILGLGLVEIIARLSALRFLGTVLNVAMALVALVIMILSLRDGVLCLQGRAREMNLQLPGGIKERIRTVARTGARHSRFVLAAFVSGVLISVLELACTGQVYAPTILYMWKTGQDRGQALVYLLAYNVAFIVPLVIVFLLATFGLRHETLIAWQVRHAAAVKFAMAGLFLLLFLFLVLGNF